MQTFFPLLLVGLLVLVAGRLALMGLGQHRRTRALAARAHETGLRFDADDPFEIPRRYADFAIVRSGHSPVAHNVIHGHRRGKPVRACDFRYELGHGTRQVTRHYELIAVETAAELPPVLMWHQGDLDLAPLAARQCVEQMGPWTWAGSEDLARMVHARGEFLARRNGSLQTCQGVLLVCLPAGRRPFAADLDSVVELAEALTPGAARQADIALPL